MERICHWAKTEKGTELYLNGHLVGLAEAAGNAEDDFVMVEEGVVCWKRTTSAPTESMTMRFIAAYPSRYQMVPALQYDENKCFYIKDYVDVRNAAVPEEKREIKKSPTYFLGNRDPETQEPWRFIWHRMSIPGATYSEGETLSTGMFLPPDQLDGACSIYAEEKTTVHELLWPEQDSRLRMFPDPEKHVKKPQPRCVFRAMLVFARRAPHRLARSAFRLLETVLPAEGSQSQLCSSVGFGYLLC